MFVFVILPFCWCAWADSLQYSGTVMYENDYNVKWDLTLKQQAQCITTLFFFHLFTTPQCSLLFSFNFFIVSAVFNFFSDYNYQVRCSTGSLFSYWLGSLLQIFFYTVVNSLDLHWHFDFNLLSSMIICL